MGICIERNGRMTIYCKLNIAGKHHGSYFKLLFQGFPGGNKEPLQQLNQVNWHPGKSRNGVFQDI
jgi:hypothetical protein